MNDQEYMARALALARNGMGWTSPNPMVGAVIVKDGRIIGEGWHRRCGQLHAEREALAACREDPAGATIYVTLEPCCHQGRQPPCTQALLEAGVGRVVVGAGDPNIAVHMERQQPTIKRRPPIQIGSLVGTSKNHRKRGFSEFLH